MVIYNPWPRARVSFPPMGWGGHGEGGLDEGGRGGLDEQGGGMGVASG